MEFVQQTPRGEHSSTASCWTSRSKEITIIAIAAILAGSGLLFLLSGSLLYSLTFFCAGAAILSLSHLLLPKQTTTPPSSNQSTPRTSEPSAAASEAGGGARTPLQRGIRADGTPPQRGIRHDAEPGDGCEWDSGSGSSSARGRANPSAGPTIQPSPKESGTTYIAAAAAAATSAATAVMGVFQSHRSAAQQHPSKDAEKPAEKPADSSPPVSATHRTGVFVPAAAAAEAGAATATEPALQPPPPPLRPSGTTARFPSATDLPAPRRGDDQEAPNSSPSTFLRPSAPTSAQGAPVAAAAAASAAPAAPPPPPLAELGRSEGKAPAQERSTWQLFDSPRFIRYLAGGRNYGATSANPPSPGRDDEAPDRDSGVSFDVA